MSSYDAKRKDITDVSKKPSLIVNALSNWITLVINVVIGFLITPYIIDHIHKAGYGIWTLVVSVIGYFGLMRMGIGAGLMRYIPYYTGKSDSKGVIGSFSTALAYFSGVGFIILGASYFAADAIREFFRASKDFENLIKIFGIAVSLGCISISLDATLRSREKFVYANYIQVSAAIFRGVGIVVVLYLGYGLLGMGLVVVAREILVFGCSLFVLRHTCSDIRLSMRSIKFRYFRELFWFGIMSLLTTFGFLIKFDADKIVVGRLMNMESVGIYSVAAMLMMYYRNFIGSGSRVLRPRFAYLDGKTSSAESVDLFLVGTRINAMLASLGVAVIAVIGPSFIRLWVGCGFEKAYTVLLILACGHLFDQSQTVTIAMLGGYGRQDILAFFMIAEGLAGTVLAVVFSKIFGLKGVALGFVLAPLISQGYLRPVYVCRYVGVKLSKYYGTVLIKPWILGAGPLIYMLFFTKTLELFTSWQSVITAAALIVAAYFTISYMVILNKDERDKLRMNISYHMHKMAKYIYSR